MIRKSDRLLKGANCLGAKERFLGISVAGSRPSPGLSRSYLNEVQYGEGEVLITEAAVHHHLDERQERAGQLAQSKHYLVREHKRTQVFFCLS